LTFVCWKRIIRKHNEGIYSETNDREKSDAEAGHETGEAGINLLGYLIVLAKRKELIICITVGLTLY
jgi:hypothetical protein